MVRVSRDRIEREIQDLIVEDEYSPRGVYEELVRRADENNWQLEGTHGISRRRRNHILKQLVKEHLTLLETIKYYVTGLSLPGTPSGEGGSLPRGERGGERRVMTDGGRPRTTGAASEQEIAERLAQYKDEGASRGQAIREVGRETDANVQRIREIADDLWTGKWRGSGGVIGRILGRILESGEREIAGALMSGEARGDGRGREGASRFRRGGRIWGYVKHWIVVIVFAFSGLMTLGSLLGGLSDLLSLSGLVWLLLFAGSGFYWYSRLGMHLPLPPGWRQEKPSDQLLLGAQGILFAWAVVLFIAGYVPLLGAIPGLGSVLGSIQLSSVLLFLGLTGAYAMYHGEATADEVRRHARVAGERARRASGRAGERARRVSGRIGEAVRRGGEGPERPGGASAGKAALQDMVETARDRAIRLHAEERIDDDQFESIESDITAAEMLLEEGKTREAERTINDAIEQLNELET